MQDADQTIAQLPQCRVMPTTASAKLVVIGPGTRRSGQCGERLLVQRITQSIVADVAGQHDLLFPPARVIGLVPAYFRARVLWIVAELAQHPGAENVTEAG